MVLPIFCILVFWLCSVLWKFFWKFIVYGTIWNIVFGCLVLCVVLAGGGEGVFGPAG